MFGHLFFYLSIIASIVIPFIFLDAIEKVRNNEDTLIHKIILGGCGGVIMWTILMMLREGLNLF